MGNAAIRVEGLGKRYRLGERAPYQMLRDTLTRAVTAPLRSLVERVNGDGAPSKTKDRKHIWALSDVSFEVERGAVLGIIGRNGSGKSTLLKILARVTEPTTGWAAIQGRVGALLEVGTGFHPELTGGENIYLSAAILGMSKLEIKQRFDEIVVFAGIDKFLDTPVKHYSSGMYLRLAFAVAAHVDPEILLLDEVLAVGDGAFREKCYTKVRESKASGRTVLLVSHDLSSVRSLCSRAVWLEGGRVQAVGDTSEVVDQYLKRISCAQPG